MTSNDASELRITIARVLEQWQRERMELGDETSIERSNVEALDASLRRLQTSETERWEELARLQAEMITALRRQLTRRARRAALAEHIDDLKRAITPTLHPTELHDAHGNARPLGPFAAEVERAARQASMPAADRIAATEDWIHSRSICDQCGAALAMVSDGDGSPPRMFCPQCQPVFEEEWSPEVGKATIEGLRLPLTGGATLGTGRRLTQAEMASLKPQRLAVAPDFAAWLDAQGLEIASIDHQGDGKATMTLAPIEEEEESDPNE